MTRLEPGSPGRTLCRLLLLLTIACAVPVAGQDEPAGADARATPPATAGESSRRQEPSSEQEPGAVGEEIHVNLVRIPLLARDRSDQPVLDLRAEEIEIKLQGRSLEVGYVEPFARARAEAPLPLVRLHLELPGGGEQVAATGEAEPAHLVLFIDVETDQKLGRPQAASQLTRFVTSDLDPAYRVAVLSFNGEIQVEQPFTRDRRAVTDAIRRAFDRPPRPQLDLRGRIFQLVDLLEECVVSRGAFVNQGDPQCLQTMALNYAAEQNIQANSFLLGLEALVRYTSGIAGRKSIVAVSHGVAMNPAPELIEAMRAVLGPATEQLAFLELDLRTGEGKLFERNALIDLALENGVTLHFIDRTSEPAGDTSARLAHAFQVGARPIQVAFTAPQWDLKEIAESTGGAFVSSPDLQAGAKEVMRLERGGYYVGVYTDHRLPRDELAKIRIRTKRPGIRLLHQRGVYASSRAERLARDIGGRIALGRHQAVPGAAKDRVRVPFQLAFDARDLGYEIQGDAAWTNFTLHFLIEDGGGRRLADAYHFVNHSLPRAEWESRHPPPVVVDGWAEVPVGEYALVAVLSNPKLGNQGEIRQTLVVAPGSAADAPGAGAVGAPREEGSS